MTRILLAEDSATQAAIIGAQLQLAGFETEIASDGVQAINSLRQRQPDIVLTDLQMPELDGLQLVKAVRRQYASIPVVLMTAHGSEEMALLALRKGALTYIPKDELRPNVAPTLLRILDIQQLQPDQQLLRAATQTDSSFAINNDPALAIQLVAHCRQELVQLGFADETGILQIAVAVSEALDRAIHQGNLEIDERMRHEDPQTFNEVAHARRLEMPFRQRRIYMTKQVTASAATYTIRHEGRPSAPSFFSQPPTTAFESVQDRSRLLMWTFMDEVHAGAEGREIKLVRRATDC